MEDTSALEDPAAAEASAAAVVTAIKTLFIDFQSKIAHARTRNVDPELAADLFNRFRKYGAAYTDSPGSASARARSNDELMKPITSQYERDWYRAQGLSPAEINTLRKASFGSGTANPSGTFLTNAANYMLAPLAAAYTGTSWANVGVGLATNLVTPSLNSLQQSAVVTMCEHIRERSGYTVTNSKTSVNDSHWPTELAAMVQDRAAECRAAGDALSVAVNDLITQHKSSAPADATAQHLMQHLWNSATQPEREQLTKLHDDYRVAQDRMDDPQRDLFMTQASYTRQAVGNLWQIIPRTLRSPVSTLVGLGQGVSAAAAAHTHERIATFPSKTSVGIQAGLALVLYGAQMLMAGVDEVNKQDYNNKINLLYGDFLTDAGKDKVRAGKPVEAGDIDQSKLRGFIVSSEQATVKRLTGFVSDTLGKQQAALDELQEDGTDEEGIAAQTLIVNSLRDEHQALRENRLTDLPENSFVAGLLGGSLDKYFAFLTTDLAKKYTGTEFSAQTAQRVGQNFHFGVFGSTGASMIGKLSSAAVGGSKHAPTGQILGIAAAGGVLGGIGAYFQSSAINIKNNRRANASDPEKSYGFTEQVKRGMFGGYHILTGKAAMNEAHAAANEALEHVHMVLDEEEAASDLAKLLDDVRFPTTSSSDDVVPSSSGVQPEGSGQGTSS